MTVYYTTEHEWLRLEGEEAVVGITQHAAEALGELVFVEIRPHETTLKAGESAAVAESVKAASDIYAPVDGILIDHNADLADNPSQVNADPEGKGWIFRLRLTDKDQLSNLMDATAYQAFLHTL
ncbi:MAG: glycine cleavage system protein GcvH [Acetobacter sp.]|nr:glycine cleavage system protein GcvH [Acetobacter sp.]